MTAAADDRTAEIAALIGRLAELMSSPPAPAPRETRTPAQRVLLTVEEAAEYLRIGRTRMFALVRTGEIESVRIGRLRRVPVTAVSAYAARLIADQHVAA